MHARQTTARTHTQVVALEGSARAQPQWVWRACCCGICAVGRRLDSPVGVHVAAWRVACRVLGDPRLLRIRDVLAGAASRSARLRRARFEIGGSWRARALLAARAESPVLVVVTLDLDVVLVHLHVVEEEDDDRLRRCRAPLHLGVFGSGRRSSGMSQSSRRPVIHDALLSRAPARGSRLGRHLRGVWGRRDVQTSSAILDRNRTRERRLGGSNGGRVDFIGHNPFGKGLETITQVVLSHHSTKDGAGACGAPMARSRAGSTRALAPHLSRRERARTAAEAEGAYIHCKICTIIKHDSRIIHHIMCQWPTRSSC